MWKWIYNNINTVNNMKWVYLMFAIFSLIVFIVGVHDLNGADFSNKDVFNGIAAFIWVVLAYIEDIKDRLNRYY